MYFIFHSPDTATVQQRMKHTMAIPGLLVHAEDVGVHVDRKTEIHEPADLVFEQEDDRAGRFRSMFNRKGFEGTEYVYANIEADRTFLDALK
jgi:twinfilin-like protein